MSQPIQGPDGNIYQFPDGTDKAAAIGYFKKKGIGAAPAGGGPAYTGNFKKDIGGPKGPARLPATDLRDERERGTPQGGLRDLYSGAKGILGSMKSIIEPHENAHYGASMEAEKAMGPVSRALFNIPADTAQSLENAEVARQKAKKSGGGVGKQVGAYAEQLPIIGSLISDVKEDRPMKALGEIGTIAAGPKVSREAGKVGAAKMAEYLPATQKYVSDALNNYAGGVGNRHFDVAPNTKTGINAGLEAARAIEPFEQMKNQEAKMSEASVRAQDKFKAKADEATRSGDVIDALPEFTAATGKLVREARNVRPDAKGGLPSPVEQSIAFFDKWNENGRLAKLTPNDAMVLKQDLDSIVRDSRGSTPPLVVEAAEKLRNIIDQKMDKQVMGWKDYNHAASGLIEASEKAREKTALAAKGKLAAQLRILASMPSTSEIAVMVPVIVGTYFLSEAMGGGMYGHIAVTTGLVSAFRAVAKGMPSASTRMAFASRLADLLYKEKMSGPSSYPLQAGPGMGLVPMGGPQGPQGGISGTIYPNQPPQGDGPSAGNLGGRLGLTPAQPGQLSPQRVQELMEQAKKEAETTKSSSTPKSESPKSETRQVPDMTDTTKQAATADLEKQRHTVKLQVNGEMREVVLTPEKLQEWEEAKQHHEMMRDMIKKNYSGDPTYMNRALKGNAMQWSAKKRQITGLLTDKERAAQEK